MARFFNLLPWRRDRLERDLDRELRYHVERRVDDLTAAGVNEAEARRQAILELGGVPQVQEAVRDTWIARGFDAFTRDVRHATRGLARSWGFALRAATIPAAAVLQQE
jgi:hypothetical protein